MDEKKRRGRPPKALSNSATSTPTRAGLPEESVSEGRDRVFIAAYFENGGNATEAELVTNPNLARHDAASIASRRLSRLRKSLKWQELLAEAGLDDMGLAAKARQLRDAKMVMLDSMGAEHIVEDNRTQLGVMQTVGRWAGKEKLDINLDASMEIKHTFDPDGI